MATVTQTLAILILHRNKATLSGRSSVADNVSATSVSSPVRGARGARGAREARMDSYWSSPWTVVAEGGIWRLRCWVTLNITSPPRGAAGARGILFAECRAGGSRQRSDPAAQSPAQAGPGRPAPFARPITHRSATRLLQFQPSTHRGRLAT